MTGVLKTCWGEARDAAKHPAMNRIAENYLTQMSIVLHLGKHGHSTLILNNF